MAAMTKKTALTIIIVWIIFTIITIWAVEEEKTTKVEMTPAGINIPSGDGPIGKMRGGIIRLGPGCPCLHTTGDHAAVGITNVYKDANGHTNIDTDFTTAENLVAAGANPDPTLVRKKVNCGVSGGGVHSVVWCARQDTGALVRADSSYFDPASDNFFFWTWAIPE